MFCSTVTFGELRKFQRWRAKAKVFPVIFLPIGTVHVFVVSVPVLIWSLLWTMVKDSKGDKFTSVNVLVVSVPVPIWTTHGNRF